MDIDASLVAHAGLKAAEQGVQSLLQFRLCTIKNFNFFSQCCKSVTFRCGSESVDPYLCLTHLAPNPAMFVSNLQDGNKKFILKNKFFAYCFLKLHLHHFSKRKRRKNSQNSRNQGFSYFFAR